MNKCYYCEREVRKDGQLRPTQDHIIPRAVGGNNSQKNKVLSCHVCNHGKGCRTPELFSIHLQAIINGYSPNTLRGCNMDVIKRILHNNDELIITIEPYRRFLINEKLAAKIKVKNTRLLSEILIENSEKYKKVKNTNSEPKPIKEFWDKHEVWTQEKFDDHFRGQQHFHYL